MDKDFKTDVIALNTSELVEKWENVRTAATMDEMRCVSVLFVNHFEKIVDKYRKKIADAVLLHAAKLIKRRLGDKAFIGIWAGPKLVIISSHLRQFEVNNLLDAAHTEFKRVRFRPKGEKPFRTSLTGGVLSVPYETTLQQAVQVALKEMEDILQFQVDKIVTLGSMHTEYETEILLAEDDELVGSMVEHNLAKDGLHVVRVMDGLSALEAAQEKEYALVVLDVKMPGKNGFEVLQELRKMDTYKNVPIIMMTSLGGDGDIVKAFKHGADDYVVKPHSPDELSARVQRLLRKRAH